MGKATHAGVGKITGGGGADLGYVGQGFEVDEHYFGGAFGEPVSEDDDWPSLLFRALLA